MLAYPRGQTNRVLTWAAYDAAFTREGLGRILLK
jgi:hypothetical protein